MKHARLAAAAWAVGVAPFAGAEEKWIEIGSPHFRVVSDASGGEARRVAQRFEQIRAVFQALWTKARMGSSRPTTIVAVRSRASLSSLVPGAYEDRKFSFPAGIYLGGGEVDHVLLRLDARGADPFQIVQHEYVHSLLRANYESLPLWLNEGLAEFWSTASIEGDEAVAGVPPEGAIWLLQRQTPPPIETMLSADHSSPEYRDDHKVQLFYSQSWALVHYLLLGPQCKAPQGRVDDYLAHLTRGLPSVSAARQAFGDLAAMQRDVQRYVHATAICIIRVRASAKVDAKAFKERTLSTAEAAAVRGEVIARGQRPGEARRLIEEALRAEPGLAAAHAALGQVALHENKREEARERFVEAARLAPNEFLFQYKAGTLLAEDLTRPGSAEAAEAAFERAIQLRPDFAPAFAAYASFLLQRNDQAERALRVARRAVSLEPGVWRHRTVVASALAQAGQLNEAEAEAERAVGAAASEAERSAAQLFHAALRNARESVKLARRLETPEDRVNAAREDCAAGRAHSCFFLGWAMEHGEGAAQDVASAVPLYEKACDGGDTNACIHLATLLAHGRGVPKDPARAVARYAQACGSGSAEACNGLGVVLVARGGAADLHEAAGAFAKACDGGHMPACANLGVLTLGGQGVARNLARARELLKRSCDGGYAPACEEIKRMPR